MHSEIVVLTSERKALIQQRLRQEGRLVAKAFSLELGISEDTIRRDLRELASEGLLQRVHGGALPASPAVADFTVRARAGSSVKSTLGRAGARLIQPGQIVFIDGGTTNIELVRQLPHDLRATVVTHSPNIAVELAGYPLIEVELIGGRLFRHSIVTVGTAAAGAIAHIRPDVCFLGVTGIHPETGATTGDAEEAAIKRLIAHQSAETIVLATREKLGAASPYQIISIAEVDTLVTEPDLPQELLEPFSATGLTLTW